MNSANTADLADLVLFLYQIPVHQLTYVRNDYWQLDNKEIGYVQ